jgi:hypothetical protein
MVAAILCRGRNLSCSSTGRPLNGSGKLIPNRAARARNPMKSWEPPIRTGKQQLDTEKIVCSPEPASARSSARSRTARELKTRFKMTISKDVIPSAARNLLSNQKKKQIPRPMASE